MKQQIAQISNIRVKDYVSPNKLTNPLDTFAAEYIDGRDASYSLEALKEAAELAYVRVRLFYHHDIEFDVEFIQPTDVRYQDAANEIATYERLDWIADDADTDFEEHPTEKYNVTWQPTMYMYFDDWIQYGYEAFVDVKKWEAAFEQIIYEYLLQFMPVYID